MNERSALSALTIEVAREEAEWLPPPPGQPFFIGQLIPVEDVGPWRGPTLDAWLTRISPWPVPWINGGSQVVW